MIAKYAVGLPLGDQAAASLDHHLPIIGNGLFQRLQFKAAVDLLATERDEFTDIHAGELGDHLIEPDERHPVSIQGARGGEGPLFAPLPPAEEAATKVALRELKGLPVELVDMLERAGHKTLQDILDLEREDVDKIPGMTPDHADKLMAFLNEMTEEGGEEEEPRPVEEPGPGSDPSAQPA